MAIGSAPEIGKEFTTWGKMSPEQQQAWFKHFKEVSGPDCVGGYATIGYPKRKGDKHE